MGGYIHAIERDAINHILCKHSDLRREGESPITEKDILCVPRIIETCEAIHYAGITGTRQKAILYIKKEERSIVYIVEEIRNGQKTLMIKTMYKNTRK